MPNYTYTYPNTNLQSITGAQIQNPYGNNNMLMNLPYNNGSSYMAQGSNSPNQFLKCRPVSSKDEARAYQIDLDGSLLETCICIPRFSSFTEGIWGIFHRCM